MVKSLGAFHVSVSPLINSRAAVINNHSLYIAFTQHLSLEESQSTLCTIYSSGYTDTTDKLYGYHFIIIYVFVCGTS